MQINSRNDSSNKIQQTITDIASKVFPIAGILTVILLAYLLYGLFSGQLTDVAGMSSEQKAHAVDLVTSVSRYLNISLILTLLSSLFLFYEQALLAYILLGLAAAFGIGLNYLMDAYFGSGSKLTESIAAQMTLEAVHRAALLMGIPGILLSLWHLFQRMREGRNRQDLTSFTYGKDAKKENVPGAAIGAFAKCWQLPFCREGIRKRCPIFHAKSKCWKERVGCMCEENIILLAMAGEDGNEMPSTAGAGMQKGSGFVPLGDLITKSEKETRPNILTRPGPKGVRIPVNPHLTAAQQRSRCHNCVIFNEHQRQKYQFLSPPVTIAIPLLVYWQFDTLKDMLKGGMHGLEGLVAHISFNSDPGITKHLSQQVTGSLTVEVILIAALTLVVMTWALRFLEYCMFKLKI